MKSLQEQLEEVKRVLNNSPANGAFEAPQSIACQEVGVKVKSRKNKVCGSKVKIGQVSHHFSKHCKRDGQSKRLVKKITLNKSFGLSQIDNVDLQLVAALLEDHVKLSKASENPLKDSDLKRSVKKKKRLTKKNLSVEPFEEHFVTSSQREVINIVYKVVMSGNIGFLKDLYALGEMDGLKLAVIKLIKYLTVTRETVKAGRMTVDQKKRFKEIREHWLSLGGDGRAVFSSLFDIAFLKNKDNLASLSANKRKEVPAEVSPLIQNAEIAKYLKRVPMHQEIGKFGVPQDKYRWGFYGSSTMDFDTWRKGEGSKK